MRSPIIDWLIVTDNLSRTVSELLQPIVSNFGHCIFEPPFGGFRDNVQYDVHLGLIEKRVVDFLLVLTELFFASYYGWVATGEKRSKIGDFAPTLPPTVFTQRNFVADFLPAKCDFRQKLAVLHFWALTSLGGLGDDHRRLIWKRVVDFLLVLTELLW